MPGSFRRLRVRRRQARPHCSWNLFARLSLKTVFELLQDSRTEALEGSSDLEDSIQFLPLELQLRSGESLFVSYNGGVCDSEDTIDLPESMLLDASISTLSVRALQFVEPAVQVALEPVEYDDWVLIEAHATWLENGGLLQQVTIVYPNQILRIQLGDRDWARVRVLGSLENSYWPEDDAMPPCFKLMEDTEVLVTPKRRPESRPLKLSLFPCAQDYDSATMRLAKLLDSVLVEVPNHCAVVHPSIRMLFDENVIVSLSPVQSSSNLENYLVLLRFDERVPEGSIALHPWARCQMQLCVHDPVNVRKLSQLELELRNATERIRQGSIRCILERVQQRFEFADVPYRYPVSASESQMSIMCCQMNEAPPRSAPVQSGSLLQVPMKTGKPRERELFRLRMISETDVESVRDAFVSLSDLIEIIESALATSPDKEKHVFAHMLSSRLTAVLGDSTCFFSSWVQLCNEMMKKPSLVIHGPRGMGKSTLASLVASTRHLKSGLPTFYLNCGKLKDTRMIRMSEILSELQRVFTDFLNIAGATLILDDVHHLVREYSESRKADDSAQALQISAASTEQAKLIADVIRKLIVQAQETSNDSMVILTCEDCVDIPAAVASAGGFETSVSPPHLSLEHRVDLLSRFLVRPASRPDVNSVFILDMCRRMEEFRPVDVKRFASCLHQNPEYSLADFIPMSRIGIKVDDSGNEQTWTDVGGLFTAKMELASAVLRPSKYKRIYKRTNVKLPRGILLFGPPGCGKSYVVPALAQECGLHVVTCKGPELLDKYIGASEAKVRELFARAAASAPCVLFLDELDSLAPKRGSDHTGVTDRVVNQLLTFLDGVEDVSDGGTIFIIGASSRPDKIDSALLRPGRLERHVYIGLPENVDELSDTMKAISRAFRLERHLQQEIESHSLVEQLLPSCPHVRALSAADIQAAFVTAQLSSVHHLLALGLTGEDVKISKTNLIQAFHSVRPSISASTQRQLYSIYASFRKSNASPRDKLGGSFQQPFDHLRVALR